MSRILERLATLKDNTRAIISTLLTLVIILGRFTGLAEKILRAITDEIDPSYG